TTTAWMYQGDAHLEPLGEEFQALVTALSKAQVAYDLGCESVLADHGLASEAKLTVGRRWYDTVVLPPLCENLNARSMDLIEAYLDGGGAVLSCGPPPIYVDGRPSDRGAKAATKPGWKQVEASKLPEVLLGRAGDGFAVRPSPSDRGILFHHRRRLDDGDLVFLVNTSIESSTFGTVLSPARGVEHWDPETGKVFSHQFEKTESGVRVPFNLPPCGSLLLFLSSEPREPAAPPSTAVTSIPPTGPMEVRRVEPNVLTLDYVDVTAGGETKRALYGRRASEFVFAKHGFDRNPWFHAFQFRDEYIARRFPPESGFSATYRFTIREQVPKPLSIVIERADLYTITCNGTPVSAAEGSWWLDRAFGKVDVTSAAKVGENEVTISACPFTMFHELEPAYLLGDFALEPVDSGFVVVPSKPLALRCPAASHTAAPNGTMWLSAGIDFQPAPPELRRRDGDPYLVFDLGAERDLKAIKVFNYNETKWTRLGVKRVKITGSGEEAAGPFSIDLGTFDIPEAPDVAGASSAERISPATLPVATEGVRFVKFDVLANHNGATYPTDDPGDFFAIVGLSEVQFFAASRAAAEPERITGVTVADMSSELSVPGVCDRRAAYLVDGSGLEASGWNDQGIPFYAAGVSYAQRFDVPRPAGRYYVRLGDWHGSVAKIVVNGRPAGYVGYRPWRREVTDLVRPGDNQIEVIVIGTLKNTLGPHHAGPGLGTMGPHHYQLAPETGPPPGAAYRTVWYGLRRGFSLEHVGP
ncbi:MAG: hypothetical protein ABIK89_22925, partial [Planctomycetota bacterium]